MSRALALHAWLVRYRFVILAVYVLHIVLVHWYFLGFASWDGLGHRVPPAVELLQHGRMPDGKYSNWALVEFHPWIELVHIPYLAAFGMPAVFFSFATSLFPFCLLSVWLFTRELTQDRNAAFYAAFVYALTPLVSAQMVAAYVDWAVCGLLAFFLYTLLALGRLRAPTTTQRDRVIGGLRFALGTLVFSLARQQAPYVAGIFFVVASALLFVQRTDGRFSVRGRDFLLSALAFAIGLVPAIRYQVKSYLAHGTPIFPFRITVFGLKIGEGLSLQEAPQLFGLEEYSTRGLLRATLHGWFIPDGWPHAFFDSRWLGLGLFADLALLSLPLTLRRANPTTRVLFASFLLVSFLAKDFWCVRFAFALVLGVCVSLGLLFSALLERPRWHALYFVVLGIAAIHALRPEWDLFRMAKGDVLPRTNISGSSQFVSGKFDVFLYPDVSSDFVIVDDPPGGFILPLFGRRLTNQVLRTAQSPFLGPDCHGLGSLTGPRRVLVVDELDKTKNCARTCAVNELNHCWAWQMSP